MEKILTQEEIDALFRASQKHKGSPDSAPAARKNITRLNLREISQISKEQVRALSALHEGFARNVTNSLGAYLRVGFSVNLVSVEQLTYSEVLSRLPDLTYLCSIRMLPIEAVALMQMDLNIAFPVIDLVLGGAGTGSIEVRELTEIEEEILESVIRLLTRELQQVWSPVLDVQIEFDQRQKSSQAVSVMAGTERSLALSFEIAMTDIHGMLNVTLPAVASNALLRKLSAQHSYAWRGNSSLYSGRLRNLLLDSEFEADLRLPVSRVHGSALTALKPGDVLPLEHSLAEPAVLLIAGKEIFSAHPVACGNMRGGHILRRHSIFPASRKAAS